MEGHKTKDKESTKHHHTRTTEDHTPTATDHGETKVLQTTMLRPHASYISPVTQA